MEVTVELTKKELDKIRESFKDWENLSDSEMIKDLIASYIDNYC